MAVALVQGTSSFQFSAGFSSGTTGTFGAGATAGNFLVAAIGIDKSAGTFTLPSGWTTIANVVGASVSLFVIGKVAVGGETTGPTINWTTAENGYMYQFLEFSGTDGVTPIGPTLVPAYSDTAVTSMALDPPAATAQCLPVAIFTNDTTTTAIEFNPAATNWQLLRQDWTATGAGCPSIWTMDYTPGEVTNGTDLGSSSFSWTRSDQTIGIILLVQSGVAAATGMTPLWQPGSAAYLVQHFGIRPPTPGSAQFTPQVVDSATFDDSSFTISAAVPVGDDPATSTDTLAATATVPLGDDPGSFTESFTVVATASLGDDAGTFDESLTPGSGVGTPLWQPGIAAHLVGHLGIRPPTPTAILHTTATDTALPIRATFYYPWFTGAGDVGYPGAWTQVTSPWTQFHPKRGYYDSTTTAVIDGHIGDMVYGGFQAGISSWWGRGSREDTGFQALLDRAQASGSGFKWCIYYEAEGNTVAGVAGSPNPSSQQIITDLNYITARYTGHPNYLHINGKPVIFAYGDPTDDNTSTIDINQRPAARWYNAVLGADEDFYTVLKVYAGYTVDQLTFPSDSWHQYGPSTAIDVQGNYSRTLSIRFWRGDETTPRLTQLDRAQWQQNIRDMVAGSQSWKLITSYNEWGEGHAIESCTGPSKADTGTNPNRSYSEGGWDSASGFGWILDDLANNGVGTETPTVWQPSKAAFMVVRLGIRPPTPDTTAPVVSSTPVTLPDDPGALDDSSFTVSAAVPLADPGTAADTLTVTATVPLADSGAAADTLTVSVAVPLSDSGSATDSLTVSVAVPLGDDPGTATDAVTVSVAVPLGDDPATSADTLSVANLNGTNAPQWGVDRALLLVQRFGIRPPTPSPGASFVPSTHIPGFATLAGDGTGLATLAGTGIVDSTILAVTPYLATLAIDGTSLATLAGDGTGAAGLASTGVDDATVQVVTPYGATLATDGTGSATLAPEVTGDATIATT